VNESSKKPHAAEHRSWYKKRLDQLVEEMLRSKAVSGAAVDATPVWAAPELVLLAKMWDASQRRNFIWAITGDGVVTDHIAGNVAATPQEAARHFSLKWQMDAERFLGMARGAGSSEKTTAQLEAFSKRLVASAELLYDFASRDELWIEADSETTTAK
jgi:hypothetical protein